MIQLANAPTSGRSTFRPEQDDGKGPSYETRRRTGHAWPFPSRYAGRPARQEGQKPTASDSGS